MKFNAYNGCIKCHCFGRHKQAFGHYYPLKGFDSYSSFRNSKAHNDSLTENKSKYGHYYGYVGPSVVQDIPCIDIYEINVLGTMHTIEGGKVKHFLKNLMKIDGPKYLNLIEKSSLINLPKELSVHSIDLNYKKVMKDIDYQRLHRYSLIPLMINSGYDFELIKLYSEYVIFSVKINNGPTTPKSCMQLQNSQINFINRHHNLLGNEGNITPKTHDGAHLPKQSILFGPSDNCREYCFESLFNLLIITSKDSKRCQTNAITNSVSNSFRLNSLDTNQVLKGKRDDTISNEFHKLSKHFNNNNVTYYSGNIKTKYFFENNLIENNSLKWIHIERNKKMITISPEIYCKSIDSKNNYIICEIEGEERFASVQCIKNFDEIIVRVG